MRFLKSAFAAGLLLAAALCAAPVLAGNTTLFSSTSGDVTFPLSPPTNAGATPGRLDNTAIGTTTPAPGAFTTLSASTGLTGPVAATTLSASGAVSGAGFTARFATPGPIGNTVASTGAFSTLSASGAVSGAGITALFASPLAIGTVAPAAGTFTAIVGTSQRFTGTAPTPTGTGTPTIVATSTDNAGEVTAGSSATSVVITFATVKSNAPFCVVTSQTQLAAFAYAVSTSAITITQTATSGNVIDYHCVQR